MTRIRRWMLTALAALCLAAPLASQAQPAPVTVFAAASLKNAGDGDVTEQHMAMDHSYSDRRIALESVVVRWLERHQASVTAAR